MPSPFITECPSPAGESFECDNLIEAGISRTGVNIQRRFQGIVKMPNEKRSNKQILRRLRSLLNGSKVKLLVA